MHHTALKKRQVTRDFDPVQVAFDMTDANGDGHIEAYEFADFYVTNMPSFGLNHKQWLTGFRQVVPKIDTNGNGTLEIDGMYKIDSSAQ
jgi:Ca2+-binding EF-hand superfamily protein